MVITQLKTCPPAQSSLKALAEINNNFSFMSVLSVMSVVPLMSFVFGQIGTILQTRTT